MNIFWLILALILVLIYFISPIDLIPDLIPVIGRLDDIFLVVMAIYYLRYGRLPGFLSWFERILWGGPRSVGSGDAGASARAGHTQREDTVRQDTAGDPYAILGVKPGASPAEIHAAYREAAQKFHPDKVSHLGEEFQAMAEKKFIEIQSAYEVLKNGKH